MKLQIKYNIPDLEEALNIAEQTVEFADIIEVGSLLLFGYGIEAINAFKKRFPEKPIYADAKISSQGEESIKLFAATGLQYLSVLAGTYHSIIQSAAKTAASYNIKIVLDFINSHSLGQSAMEAKTLGAHAILLHRSILSEENEEFLNQWQEVRANTDLPLFIKGRISKKIIHQLLPLRPYCFIIGSSIVKANNPRQEAKELHDLITGLSHE